MRRRDLLWLMSLGWLYSPGLLIRPAAAHREGSNPTSAAGRQTVRIPAPTFTLTDQDGDPFVFQSWRGRAVLVTFGFTTCQDVCPILAANLAFIQQHLSRLPQSTPGSRRKDNRDLLKEFEEKGYKSIGTRIELNGGSPEKLVGLFHLGNITSTWIRPSSKKMLY